MNNVLKLEDKKGGRTYPTWMLQDSEDVLEDYELYDVGLT